LCGCHFIVISFATEGGGALRQRSKPEEPRRDTRLGRCATRYLYPERSVAARKGRGPGLSGRRPK